MAPQRQMHAGRRVLSAIALAMPRAVARLRASPPPERLSLVVLVALSITVLVGGQLFGSFYVPPSAHTLPLLGGALLLRRRAMRLLVAVVAACMLVSLLTMGFGEVRFGTLVVVAVMAVVAYEFSSSSEQTGLYGSSGDTFVVELRERLQRQGRLPELPYGWSGEAVLSPAGGGPFAGDFVVSALVDDGQCLELALVDVSGKGVEAGTRALLLSGALGGLLGSMRPDGFLPAANRYLDRQQWEEGFATAVHVVLDLRTGAFSIETAGHPPVAHFDAGSGRWSLLDGSGGVALGLLPDVSYAPVTGRLDRGDALLLYTDGLVEVPGRDLSVGIDKLLGEAERLVPRGFAGGGRQLVARVANTGSDDRGLVLLWRDA